LIQDACDLFENLGEVFFELGSELIEQLLNVLLDLLSVDFLEVHLHLVVYLRQG
jgi:hypothetical protein